VTMPIPIRVMSFGGGVQSTAMLVLAAQNKIDYPIALFCNVGEDSENPATLDYIRDHSKPYADAHGIEFVELSKTLRDGSTETVMGRIRNGDRSIGIPVRMSNGAPGNRQCTADFKIRVVAKEIKNRGATPDNPATVALGISMDEFQRMRSSSGIAYQTNAYPLIDLGLTRQDCLNVIDNAGLPPPPKSSCFFCPFHTKAAWKEQARNEPDLFQMSVSLEQFINKRQAALGKDEVWLSSALKPLDQAFSDDGQINMFDDETCDIAGYCMS
jgi:hypothetical protein